MTCVQFFIPTEPQGKASPRAVRVGAFVRVVKDAKTRRYEDMIGLFASTAMAGRPLFDEPLRLMLQVVMSVPASWSRKRQSEALAGGLLPTRRPDCSNVLKAVEDGCNGVVWRDDALVVDAWVGKRYGAQPGVRVVVTPIGAAVEVRAAA